MKHEGFKTIADNRKARHDYFILESFEAGMELVGTEVKSIRQGGVNLKDSWCSIDNGEIFIKGMHISPYEKGNQILKATDDAWAKGKAVSGGKNSTEADVRSDTPFFESYVNTQSAEDAYNSVITSSVQICLVLTILTAVI